LFFKDGIEMRGGDFLEVPLLSPAEPHGLKVCNLRGAYSLFHQFRSVYLDDYF
jgi:hypothetical protein